VKILALCSVRGFETNCAIGSKPIYHPVYCHYLDVHFSFSVNLDIGYEKLVVSSLSRIFAGGPESGAPKKEKQLTWSDIKQTVCTYVSI